MGRKYFGTDGVRGRVGQSPITPEFIMRLGFAAGSALVARDGPGANERPAVLIGKDTRISGYMLEAALEAGFSAAGVDVMLCGPMPTPAVAYLTRALRLQAGVVISASHNPYDDNGIKFFSAQGTKLPDAVELEIEARLEQPMTCMESARLVLPTPWGPIRATLRTGWRSRKENSRPRAKSSRPPQRKPPWMAGSPCGARTTKVRSSAVAGPSWMG